MAVLEVGTAFGCEFSKKTPHGQIKNVCGLCGMCVYIDGDVIYDHFFR